MHVSWNNLSSLLDITSAVEGLSALEKLTVVGNPALTSQKPISVKSSDAPVHSALGALVKKFTVQNDENESSLELSEQQIRLMLVRALAASVKVMCAFEQGDGTPMVEKITESLRQSATEFCKGKEGRKTIANVSSACGHSLKTN